MVKHKSKIERYRDICDAVFFSNSKGIKPVPYQVAKEIGYPQSHTTSYMNELAKKKILIKKKSGIYSLPKFRDSKQLEKAIDKMQLSKYYSWKIIDKLRNDLSEKEELEDNVEHAEIQQESDVEKEWFRIQKEKDKIDKEISYILDIIKDFPLSFFVIHKTDLLKWIKKEIQRLEDASSFEELDSIAFNIDLIIRILGDSARIIK